MGFRKIYIHSHKKSLGDLWLTNNDPDWLVTVWLILETSQLNQKHGAANVLGMQSGSLFFSLLIFQRKAYNKLMKGL